MCHMKCHDRTVYRKDQRINRLTQDKLAAGRNVKTSQTGFEPVASTSAGLRSIQLSYWDTLFDTFSELYIKTLFLQIAT